MHFLVDQSRAKLYTVPVGSVVS